MLKIKSTKVSNRAQYIFSIFVLVFIFTFVFLISFYRIPLGDDVLTQFMNGGAQYIDGYSGGIGNQISDFYSLYQSVRWFYLNWGGRIIGAISFPLLSIFGQFFVATITGILYAYLIFISSVLIFNCTSKPLSHPAAFIILFLLIIYLNPAINYLLMWTFTSIYVLSLALLATYYYITSNDKIYNHIKNNKQYYFTFNLFGLICGLTHEVYGVTFLGTILYLSYKNKGLNKNIRDLIIPHTGLIIGVLLCVLAPGNIVRLNNGHDSKYMSISYLSRLIKVIWVEMYVTFGAHGLSLAIFALLGFVVLYRYATLKCNFKFILTDLFHKNSSDIFVILFFTIVSSALPYMGSYGALLLLFWLSVIFLKNIYIYSNLEIVSRLENNVYFFIAQILLLISLVVTNGSWILSMAAVTNERATLTKQAIDRGMKCASVPRYSDSIANRFNFYNYNNYANHENETDYYIKFFGIRLQTCESINQSCCHTR